MLLRIKISHKLGENDNFISDEIFVTRIYIVQSKNTVIGKQTSRFLKLSK